MILFGHRIYLTAIYMNSVNQKILVWGCLGGSVTSSLLLARYVCPFAGPDTGESVLAMLASLLIVYAILTLLILLANKIKFGNCILWVFFCAVPPLSLSVLAVRNVESNKVDEREILENNLGMPLPISVANVRSLRLRITPDKGILYMPTTILFDIAEHDVAGLLTGAHLVQVPENEVRDRWNGSCDTSQIPGDPSWDTYLGRGLYGSDYFVRVSPCKTRAAFIKNTNYQKSMNPRANQ